MEFFYFILGFILLILFFRLFFRYVLPWLLLRWVRRKQREFEKAYGQQHKKAGEMEVKFDPGKEKDNPDVQLGDYVDYEDLPDDKN